MCPRPKDMQVNYVLATRIDGSVRSWDTNIRYKKYVNEAKRRKLSCGVPELSQSNNRIHVPTTQRNASKVNYAS